MRVRTVKHIHEVEEDASVAPLSLKDKIASYMNLDPTHNAEDTADSNWDTFDFKTATDDQFGFEGTPQDLRYDNQILPPPELDEEFAGEKTSLDTLGWENVNDEEEDIDEEVSSKINQFYDMLTVDDKQPKLSTVKEAEMFEAQLSLGPRDDIQTFEVTDELEKAAHTKNQSSIWDDVLGIRVELQKLQRMANRLPQFDTLPMFESHDGRIKKSVSRMNKNVGWVVKTLLDVQDELLNQNPPSGVDMSSLPTADNEDPFEQLLERYKITMDTIDPFLRETTQKWNDKVLLASGVQMTKFKTLNKRILDQIDEQMEDKDNLIRRSQLQRSSYRVLGKRKRQSNQQTNDGPDKKRASTESMHDSHLEQHDSQIYDDDDFYAYLLRNNGGLDSKEFTTYSTGRFSNSKPMKMKWPKNQKQIRYNIHPQIENFMAPKRRFYPKDDDVICDQLFLSLFGSDKWKELRREQLEEERAAEENEGLAASDEGDAMEE